MFTEENAFFTGIVSKYDRKTEKHTVTYDDGDVEDVDPTDVNRYALKYHKMVSRRISNNISLCM